MREMSDTIREIQRLGVTHLEGLRGFSPLRQNEVYDLGVGEASHFHVTTPVIYSFRDGGKVALPPWPISIDVDEKALSVVMPLHYFQIDENRINTAIQVGVQKLINLEYKFMYNTFFNAQEIETIESDDLEEVKRVQQFHWNTGNYKTRILPNSFKVDFEAICKKELTALIRTPVTIEVQSDPASSNMNIVIWETVGCMFKVTEKVSKWLPATSCI